jgi:hypothetical protein
MTPGLGDHRVGQDAHVLAFKTIAAELTGDHFAGS